MIGYLLRRQHSAKQTLGHLFLFDGLDLAYSCCTLEPPWRNNETDVSCIPAGSYKVESRWSEKYGDHFHILDVEGRTLILIHGGNTYHHTRGCVLPGRSHTDINRDGYRDVTSSRDTMRNLLLVCPLVWTLRVLEDG